MGENRKTNAFIFLKLADENLQISDLMDLQDENQLVKQACNIGERNLRQSCEKQLWNPTWKQWSVSEWVTPMLCDTEEFSPCTEIKNKTNQTKINPRAAVNTRISWWADVHCFKLLF